MHFADQLTLARAFSVPVVVVLFAWDFPNHYYWATAVFALAMTTDYVDGWWARRTNRSSNLGRLLDPVADKLLVMAALIMLVGVALPAWMVAAIVAREFLMSGLRLAALERGVVMAARDLGKLKTGAQATAAAIAGLAAGGAFSTDIAWWAGLVALALTWISGLDYFMSAPQGPPWAAACVASRRRTGLPCSSSHGMRCRSRRSRWAIPSGRPRRSSRASFPTGRSRPRKRSSWTRSTARSSASRASRSRRGSTTPTSSGRSSPRATAGRRSERCSSRRRSSGRRTEAHAASSERLARGTRRAGSSSSAPGSRPPGARPRSSG